MINKNNKDCTANEVWEDLLILNEQLNIIKRDGYTIFNTNEIKDVGKRLKKHVDGGKMVYFDNPNKMPKIFKEYGLTLIPLSLRDYAVGYFETFHPINFDKSNIIKKNWIDNIHMLDYRRITSESALLAVIKTSRISEDFIGENIYCDQYNDKNLTTGNFNMNIRNNKTDEIINLNISGARYETDSSYETHTTLYNIETKIFSNKNEKGNYFSLKQLYYAFRRLSLIKGSKDVKSIFIAYRNNIAYLFMYKFNDLNNINSIELIKSQCYEIEEKLITYEDIDYILKTTPIKENSNLPQASNFNKVITLLENMNNNNITRKKVEELINVGERTADYYLFGCDFLNFLYKEKIGTKTQYSLKSDMNLYLNKNTRERNLHLITNILQYPIYRDVLDYYFKNGKLPTKKAIMINIKKYEYIDINDTTTLERKSSSVRTWVGWIINQINDDQINHLVKCA